MDLDSRFTADRAVVFTGPAADAQFTQYIGAFDDYFFSVNVFHFIIFQPDGFLSKRADFLTDTTYGVVCPGQAAIRIYAGEANGCALFFIKRQRRDGTSRADFYAGGTGKTALPQARDKAGCEDILEATFQETGLQTLGWADTYAFAAAHTNRSEISQQPAGRADHAVRLAAVDGFDTC